MEFSELPIPPAVMAGIEAAGFSTCTPIQEMTLPLTMNGHDVAGQAQTGTGKTAAYLIACFSRMLETEAKEAAAAKEGNAKPPPKAANRSRPRLLVIAPTRELAVQIEQDALLLGKETGLFIGAVYGGVDYEKQKNMLTSGKVDVLIGTPGRLIDYFKQKFYSCSQVEALVIDEADRMFDMGFIADLRYLLRRLPPPAQRISMLFSATLSYRAQELSYEYMNDPEVISTPMEARTADQVNQCLYHVESKRKISLLVGLLRSHLTVGEDGVVGRVMIFINTKRMGERLENWLEHNGLGCGYLSGDVPQAKRLKVLKRFQNGEMPVLIATDVAGRGLHIDGVTLVVNYDLPENAEDYVHRIGRTARAGAKGDAISLVDEEGAYCLEAIEAYAGIKIPISWAEDEDFIKLSHPPRRVSSYSRDKRDGRSGGRGGRPSSGGGKGGRHASGGGGSGRKRPHHTSSSTPQEPKPASESAAKPESHSQGAPPPAKKQGEAAANAAPGSDPNAAKKKKKRRRRRKKPQGGGEGSAPQGTSQPSGGK
ncbi:MAG: DEAD/DEAH box helicase [Magnetococcales bacterium]|nr:DEAD/DEAH box helicase [Magnetococcales bacterium]